MKSINPFTEFDFALKDLIRAWVKLGCPNHMSENDAWKITIELKDVDKLTAWELGQ